jgi:hypothetical protein
MADPSIQESIMDEFEDVAAEVASFLSNNNLSTYYFIFDQYMDDAYAMSSDLEIDGSYEGSLRVSTSILLRKDYSLSAEERSEVTNIQFAETSEAHLSPPETLRGQSPVGSTSPENIGREQQDRHQLLEDDDSLYGLSIRASQSSQSLGVTLENIASVDLMRRDITEDDRGMLDGIELRQYPVCIESYGNFKASETTNEAHDVQVLSAQNHFENTEQIPIPALAYRTMGKRFSIESVVELDDGTQPPSEDTDNHYGTPTGSSMRQSIDTPSHEDQTTLVDTDRIVAERLQAFEALTGNSIPRHLILSEQRLLSPRLGHGRTKSAPMRTDLELSRPDAIPAESSIHADQTSTNNPSNNTWRFSTSSLADDLSITRKISAPLGNKYATPAWTSQNLFDKKFKTAKPISLDPPASADAKPGFAGSIKYDYSS